MFWRLVFSPVTFLRKTRSIASLRWRTRFRGAIFRLFLFQIGTLSEAGLWGSNFLAVRPISGAQAHDQSGADVIAGLVGATGGRVLREGYAQVSFLGARCWMY